MQQVNLYSEILKAQEKQSGINLFLGIFAAVVVLCAWASIYGWWQANQTETNLHNVQALLTQQQEKVNKLMASRAVKAPDGQLVAELEQWQSSVNEVAATLQMLSGKETILAQGFSFYMTALAQQSNPDVWFTGIHIDGSHHAMVLEGSTFKPLQLPQVLQQLQQQPALKGLTFANLVMQESAEIAGQIDFTLGSIEQPKNATNPTQ